MNGASNPYQLVSDEDFKDAIDKLEADADETCNSSDIYEKFGVSGESLDAYLLSEGFSESSMVSFINGRFLKTMRVIHQLLFLL